MINEERVKEQVQLATFDQHENKQYHQMGEYYRGDFIAKEIIKSFFSGTIAFALILALYVLNDIEVFLKNLTGVDFVALIGTFILLYMVFMLAYLFITYLIYLRRYQAGRKNLKGYYNHIRKLNRMYEREEKLKG